MRTRDNSHTGAFSYVEVSRYTATGAIYRGPVTVSGALVSPDVMMDVVTPKYRELSAKGGIVNSRMVKHKAEKTLTSLEPYRIVGREGTLETVASGTWVPARLAYNPTSASAVVATATRLQGLAITEAYSKVGSPDVAVLTELAELRETLSFLYSPVKGMLRLTNRFKEYIEGYQRREAAAAKRLARWNKRSAVATLRGRPVPPPPPPAKHPPFRVGKYEATDLSSAWLAYRYGLMPLIYTFQDVQALLKKRLEGTPVRATARARSKGVVDPAAVDIINTSWQGTPYTITTTRKGYVKVSVRAGVLYEVDATLLTQLGIQWNRVPAALYEATPLSFVADWFWNGAQVYDALTAEARSGRILAAWVTTQIEYDFVIDEKYSTASAWPATGIMRFRETGKWKERKPASLSDVSVKFRLDLNSYRIADGLALIHQFLATALKKRK